MAPPTETARLRSGRDFVVRPERCHDAGTESATWDVVPRLVTTRVHDTFGSAVPQPEETHRPDATDELGELLGARILVLDGAMGTMIQEHRLDEAAYRGARFASYDGDLAGDNDLLSLSNPDVIRAIHRAYLDAGADIICTNTFNGTRISQADYGLEDLCYELNLAAAKLAREAADDACRGRRTPPVPRRGRPAGHPPRRAEPGC